MKTELPQTERNHLACPNCGDTFLHQHAVEVFDRNEEDAEDGTHTTADYGDGVHVDQSMSGNPSSRRDGIKIRFWCELCDGWENREDAELTLCISQHKGQERIYWEEPDE